MYNIIPYDHPIWSRLGPLASWMKGLVGDFRHSCYFLSLDASKLVGKFNKGRPGTTRKNPVGNTTVNMRSREVICGFGFELGC
jgi:hypothetical protein